MVSFEHLIFLARQKAHERLRRCFVAIVKLWLVFAGMCCSPVSRRCVDEPIDVDVYADVVLKMFKVEIQSNL